MTRRQIEMEAVNLSGWLQANDPKDWIRKLVATIQQVHDTGQESMREEIAQLADGFEKREGYISSDDIRAILLVE